MPELLPLTAADCASSTSETTSEKPKKTQIHLPGPGAQTAPIPGKTRFRIPVHTLKKEATKPAAKNFLQQQGKFDHFMRVFNHERPHQALAMKYPAELYTPSPRPYQGLSELEYPFHDRTIMVTECGRICIGRRKINLSQVFAGQNVGVKEIEERIWLVSFMQYDLGFFDHETGRIECAENPFGAKVLPMSPV
jgi:putative transposase